MEAMGEFEPLDLGALRLARAIGHERQPDAGIAQRIDRGVGIGIEPVFLAPQFGERVGNPIGQFIVGSSQSGKTTADRQAAGARDVEPPFRGLGPVVPEGTRLLHDGRPHARDGRLVMSVQMGGKDMEQAGPRLLRLRIGTDQRVVHVEQDGAGKPRLGKSGHVSSSAGPRRSWAPG